MKNILIKILLIIMVGLPFPVLAQKRPEVGGRITTGPTTELLSVAIDNFRLPAGFSTSQDSNLAIDLREVLKRDLIFSLYFNVVDVDSAFLEGFTGGKMSLDDWIYLGAQMLISGRLEREGEGLLLSIDVIDAFRNKNAYNRDFVGDTNRYRYLAHQVAGDLLHNLVGEEGCFNSRIVYSSNATGAFEIYICDFDGYAPAQITSDKSINMLPSWSHDCRQLYYTSYRADNPDLYSYVLETKKVYTISSRDGINSSAAVSPDGQYIACSLTLGSDSEIYLLDGAGRIAKRITFSPMIDTAPAWSPSSREIAFTSDRTGAPQIYVCDSDGLNTRRLTFQGDYNDQASWSPRGDLIAYTTREYDGFNIYTVDITGTYVNRLTEFGHNQSPSWSPDGLHIIYSSKVGENFQLFVMDYNGMNSMRLELPGSCKGPEWSKNIK